MALILKDSRIALIIQNLEANLIFNGPIDDLVTLPPNLVKAILDHAEGSEPKGVNLQEVQNLSVFPVSHHSANTVNPSEPLALEYLRRIEDSHTSMPAATLEDLQRDRVNWELYLEGLRHMRNKEYRQAIEVWERVLQAYPNNPATLDNIEQARLRLQTEDSDN